VPTGAATDAAPALVEPAVALTDTEAKPAAAVIDIEVEHAASAPATADAPTDAVPPATVPVKSRPMTRSVAKAGSPGLVVPLFSPNTHPTPPDTLESTDTGIRNLLEALKQEIDNGTARAIPQSERELPEGLSHLARTIVALAPRLQGHCHMLSLEITDNNDADALEMRRLAEATLDALKQRENREPPRRWAFPRAGENNCLIDAIFKSWVDNTLTRQVRILLRAIMILCSLLEAAAGHSDAPAEQAVDVHHHVVQIQELHRINDYLTIGSAAAFNKYILHGVFCFVESRGDGTPLSLHASAHADADPTRPALLMEYNGYHFTPLYRGRTTLQAAASVMRANFEASTRHVTKESSEVSQLIVNFIKTALDAMSAAYTDVEDTSNVHQMHGAALKIAKATHAAMVEAAQAFNTFEVEYTKPKENEEPAQTRTCDLSGPKRSFVAALNCLRTLAGLDELQLPEATVTPHPNS